MRKNQEINKAVAILRKKGDLVSLEQASVLSDRLNERSVFDKYVAGVAEADRSEGIYYACRDAARFLKGELTLDELIPDHEQEDDIAGGSQGGAPDALIAEDIDDDTLQGISPVAKAAGNVFA